MSDPDSSQPPPRNWLSRGLRGAASRAPTVAQIVAYAAIAVRVSARDQYPVAAPLYYAVPPAVAAGLLVLAGALDWRWGTRVRPRAARVLLVALLLAWHGRLNWRDHAPREGALSVLVWNTSHGAAGWDQIAAQIERLEPTIVALVEADGGVPTLRRLLPNHTWAAGTHGMVIGAREVHGTIHTERVALGGGGRAVLFTIPLSGRKVYGLLVDVVPDPWHSRAEAFAHIVRLIAAREPDLILGDFNTPRDSVHFDAWRPRLRHAFEDAGRGVDSTWPWPLPVIAIDHAWSGPRLAPQACRVEGTRLSDHRMVIASYAWTK